MGLNLNDTVEPYKEANGDGRKAIPELVADGRVLLGVAGLAERRLHSAQTDWKNNYFFLGDVFAYNTDGKFKVVLNSEHLRNVNGNTRLVNGAIPLEDGVYDALEGEEFVVGKIQEYLGRDLSPEEVKGNPVWKAFIPDKALRDEYTDRMSAEMKQRFNYDKTMGVFPSDNTGGKTAIIRPAVVVRLGDYGCVGSLLSGRDGVDDNLARWVGVAPEALNAPGKVSHTPTSGHR